MESVTLEANDRSASAENEVMDYKHKKYSVRIKESEQEMFMYEAEEETLNETDFNYELGSEEDYYVKSSRNTRTSQASVTTCPTDDDFFKMSSFSWSEETSEDTIEIIESYHQLEIEQEEEEDFFEKLGPVPELKEISTDSVELAARKSKTLTTSPSLHGKFVDPLTGKFLPSDDSDEFAAVTALKAEEEEHASEEQTEKDDASYEEFSFDDFDTCFPEEVRRATVVQEPTLEDIDLIFADQEELDLPIELSVSPELQPTAQLIAEQATKFLDDIIKYVIRYCEEEQSLQLIKNKLDKRFIFREMKKLIMELDTERKVSTFLLRKCVEHHRRKGNLRYLQEENPEKIFLEIAAYKEKADYLNHILEKELAMARKIQRQILELTFQVEENEEDTKFEVMAFENLVKKTLKCNSKPGLEKFINSQLSHMATLREEISSTRALIIQRQHTLATLKAKLNNIELIGNGLRLADYENLQREMQALSKKIEDRNHELTKMHARFYHNLHGMAHMKMKSGVTMLSINIQQDNLRELEVEAHLTRERLFKLNLAHKFTRRQLTDVSLESGLLDKPVLLRDYDETVERLQQQRHKNQELKKTQTELEAKLEQLQAPLDQLRPKSTGKSKSLKLKPAPISIEGLEGFCLNF